MKKITLILSTFICLLVFTQQAFALTTKVTPTAAAVNTTANEKLDQQINQLKEKIASRVSELNLVEKRGIIGTVTEEKANQITMTDMAGNVRFADVDEITKFSSTGSKGFGLSDLTKGTKISILGIYNKQSQRILARFINTYTSPQYYTGTITAIDAKNYRFTMATSDQKQIVADVDTSSKISSYNATDGLVKYGFSKINTGDRVRIVGNPSKTDANLFTTSRVIDYLGIPKDPSVSAAPAAAAQSAVTPTAAPTAAGNKKLNPIK
jgi:hypothetical protein